MKNFYITTTIPYVNAAPHIGFALEITQADVIARYKRLRGYDVFFNFGTDEHGQKIWQNAADAGVGAQEYTDEYAVKFQALKGKLNLTYDAFIRTTDEKHKHAAQEMWRLCKAKGDIYKKNYAVKYCIGCELEKTDSELTEGKCPFHPNKDLEVRNEENYFFKLSAYQEQLQKLYERTDFVVPDFRLNEIRALIEKGGLQDFSVSRLKAKMPWGVAVPDDADQVMYVWFDALVNYISTLDWPQSETRFRAFWDGSINAVQMAGKDQVRQQACMWQAMLISAGLPYTGQIFIHGFIQSGGQKMSKSLGNVIDPITIVDEYGVDALRYFLLRHVHPTEDSDFTMSVFAESFTAGLTNGIGNLTARIMRLAEQYLEAPVARPQEVEFDAVYTDALDHYEFNKAMDFVWDKVQRLDQRISTEEPFKVIKVDAEKGAAMIQSAVTELYSIAHLLQPLLPATSDAIKEAILANKKPENLFPRK